MKVKLQDFLMERMWATKKKEKSEIALRLCTSDTEWLLVQSTETGKIEKEQVFRSG